MDSPAAQAEVALLQSLKLGDVRRGVLLPALDIGVEWKLIAATPGQWEFDGTFFGQPFYRLTIRIDGAKLTLDVSEAA